MSRLRSLHRTFYLPCVTIEINWSCGYSGLSLWHADCADNALVLTCSALRRSLVHDLVFLHLNSLDSDTVLPYSVSGAVHNFCNSVQQ